MNCNNCRALLPSQSNYCPSCGRAVFAPAKNYDPALAEHGRKFMIFLAIYMMSEMFLLMMHSFLSPKMMQLLSPFTDVLFTVLGFVFAIIPLAISFLLPKNEFARIFLIIIGSAYFLFHLGEKIYEWFFVKKQDFIYFQF